MSFRPTFAEGQAIGLCFMARQPGLPEIDTLRRAVAQLHPTICGWCDYPPSELLVMLESFRVVPPTRTTGAPLAMPAEEARWWAMPNVAKRRAIELAQHGPRE